ncbi:SAM-dependent methyltransferase [Nostoc sp. T09]|uniref:class I SAM-dependent methyltransferase n=1 Tax=Nostoc sp. T09 TaxID=1932621 RepID=UPI000A3B1FB7|nr:class I SAM-dependent methyltransferase [Nostoc sp. T09]OUL37139.1 SAM-dependent methyltransferase [Nostoc sp. T09]
MDQYFETNKQLWNKLTQINIGSKFYDVDGFEAGKLSLNSIEMSEVGDVRDKTLLHLQCHFGMDTISWAKLGAKVTGIDISENAIIKARELSNKLEVNANFICTDIYNSPNKINEKFDIVFTSYGTICWLPDLNNWGEVIKEFIKPGGFFYIVEFHPVVLMLDEAGKKLKYPYFHSDEPLSFENESSYAEPDTKINQVSYEWTHSLSDAINALINAGLKIEYVHEYPYSVYNCWTFLTEIEPGKWVVKDYPNLLPLMYSIKASN